MRDILLKGDEQQRDWKVGQSLRNYVLLSVSLS